VADRLGIPLYVLDLSDAFSPIIDYFVAEYARGRTPNPCVLCNSRIKFGRLIAQADQIGAKYVATGHYARTLKMGTGTFFANRASPGSALASDNDAKKEPVPIFIARAANVAKDQSYALFAIARENLGRILLPIGEVADKAAVRQRARDLGLNVHDKPDSQEICFVPDDDHVVFLRRRLEGKRNGLTIDHCPLPIEEGSLAVASEWSMVNGQWSMDHQKVSPFSPGNIINSSGKVLGRHEGFAGFTIGQRHGLRVGGLAAPHYVTRIDPGSGDVTIGPREETLSRHLRASAANWHADVPDEFDAIVQVRYNHRGAAGHVRRTSPDGFEAQFREPVAAITPGQAAVVYDGDRLLGGAWID
jgi:tRNA-specific 2-thiouridylase